MKKNGFAQNSIWIISGQIVRLLISFIIERAFSRDFLIDSFFFFAVSKTQDSNWSPPEYKRSAIASPPP